MTDTAMAFDLDQVKGFMDPDEGAALTHHAGEASGLGPALEIGSYCGKSAVFIGWAVRKAGSVLFTVDHHRGSEENQPGWDYFDPEVWDDAAGAVDTLPFLRTTLRWAGLEDTVIPIIGRSPTVSAHWRPPLGFLFIDGGHTLEHALADYRGWTPHLVRGGVLAIHDVFPDPADGGQAPHEIHELALASGLFEPVESVKSLRVLRRL